MELLYMFCACCFLIFYKIAKVSIHLVKLFSISQIDPWEALVCFATGGGMSDNMQAVPRQAQLRLCKLQPGIVF